MDFKALELEMLKQMEDKNPITPNDEFKEVKEFMLNIAKNMIPVMVQVVEKYHEKLNMED